jgi:anaerobic magnesium-protoporphyrin IX monomethyl ester cyclase
VSKKIVLVESPNGKAWDIPFGTLPALTGYLRSHNYNVDQYDLNNEVLLQLLEPKYFDEIMQLLDEKINTIEKFMKKRRKGLGSKLKRFILRNKFLLSIVQKIYFNFVSHKIRDKDTGYSILWYLRDSKKKLTRIKEGYLKHKEAFENAIENKKYDYWLFRHMNRDYHFLLGAMYHLTTPLKKDRKFFDRFEDQEYNLYYSLYKNFIERINWEEVSVIGITSTSMSKLAALTLARIIKTKYPKVHIVLGGMLFHEINFDSEYDINDLKTILTDFADTAVRGEGELAIKKIIDNLDDLSKTDDIPNILRLVNGELIVTKPFRYEGIKDLPDYDFEGLPMKYYSGLPIEVSRGCYWGKCTFCRYYYMHLYDDQYSNGPYYRTFSIDEIIGKIKKLSQKYEVKNFEFVCLDISPKQAKDLCHAIIKEKIDIQWNARIRLDKSFTPELFHLLKESGATMYMFYPETFSKRVAKLHNKNYDIDHIKSLISYWTEHQAELLPLVVKIMTGFPGERFKDFKETMKYIEKQNILIQNIGFFNITKGCDVYLEPEKFNLKIIEKYNPDELFYHFKARWDEEQQKERYKIESWVINKEKKWRKRRIGWRQKYIAFLEE